MMKSDLIDNAKMVIEEINSRDIEDKTIIEYRKIFERLIRS